ncbi:MFS transporter [Demequina subtropica]|uniref:MFS transporter n=1 Tax=Demequina subtropica TaxID=1638989 RepID=UPI000782F600|nr:MFS transporter [Demequina subtropica]
MSQDLVRLRRRYVTLTALRWLPTGLVAPLIVLLLSTRGMSLTTIGLLTALFSASTLLLELPTGGLADVVGRRGVIVASSLVSALGSTLVAFANSAAWFAVAFVLMGLARALDSGPLEAWYVDRVHAVDPDADLTPGLSRAAVAESGSLAVGALAAGAAVAIVPGPTSGAGLVALSVPFFLRAVLSLVQIAVTLAWVDEVPDRRPGLAAPQQRGALARIVAGSRASAREVPATVARGLRVAGGSARIRRLLAFTGALGVALAGIELLAPARASALLGGEAAAAGPYAVLVTAGFLGSSAGAALAPAASRLFRHDARAAALSIAGAAIALACVALPLAGAAAAAFVAFYLLLGVSGPLTASLLHGEVGSAERATLLSVQSMALQSAALVCTAALGAVAGATSLAVGFGALAGALACGALAIGRWPAPEPRTQAGSAEDPAHVPATR